MSWKRLVDDRRLKPHRTSYRELFDLRELVLGKVVLACAGYRAGGPGHHQTTFEALELAMGPRVADLVAYFDACRRKRNQLDYDMAHVATESEAAELLRKAHEFREAVEGWIAAQHPQFRTDAP
jgi:hypothetical protein